MIQDMKFLASGQTQIHSMYEWCDTNKEPIMQHCNIREMQTQKLTQIEAERYLKKGKAPTVTIHYLHNLLWVVLNHQGCYMQVALN